MRRSYCLAALLLLAMLAAGCSAATPAPTPPSTPVATSTPRPTATATPVPTDTPTPSPLTPAAIFQQVSPSIAYVETEIGSGSGFLIEGGYLVTNAHVVEPFETVRVVFPDGAEFLDAPVANVDLLADLAIVGPLDTELPPLALKDREDLAVGSRVYLIGYPGEVDKFPQPTISGGIISRMREWTTAGISFFQTDASVAGGQSGGILASELGELIGISGQAFAGAKYALVASAKDIEPRVDALIRGEDIDGLGKRMTYDPTKANKHQLVVLEDDWTTDTFVMQEPLGTSITLDLDGEADFGFFVQDPAGFWVAFENNSYGNKEHAEFVTEVLGPHFITVYQNEKRNSVADLRSNVKLAPLRDPDDRLQPKLGEPTAGNIDYPGDSDVFRLYLHAGDRVNIHVESLIIDPVVMIDMVAIPNDDDDPMKDDDSGAGIFGRDAELTLEAPATGSYLLIVEATNHQTGGYVLTVANSQEGDPTPMAPAPTPTPIASSLGNMNLYTSHALPAFSFQYPEGWSDRSANAAYNRMCTQVDACLFSTDPPLVLAITLEDLSALGFAAMTQEDYTQLTITGLETIDPNSELLRQETYINEQGTEITELEYQLEGGRVFARRLIHVIDEQGVNVTALIPGQLPNQSAEQAALVDELHEESNRLVDYIFNSFAEGNK